jgi:hypothetical protein
MMNFKVAAERAELRFRLAAERAAVPGAFKGGAPDASPLGGL